jgi:hypothetical protein
MDGGTATVDRRRAFAAYLEFAAAFVVEPVS